MLRRLSAKLTMALVAIIAVTCMAWIALTLIATRLYQEEVDQSLNSPLAHYISKAYPLITDGKLNRDSLTGLFDQLMVINPRIEVYLLDLDGHILAFSAEPGHVKRDRVNLAPLRSWIAGPDSLPLRGDDPRDLRGSKPFSAAEVYDGGRHAGYLYVVLGGEEYQSVADMLSASYILRLALGAGGLGVALALAVGVLSFAWLTRRLTRLTGVVEAFRETGFEAPAKPTGWRRDGDEIDSLGIAFEEMSQRISDQIKQLHRADATRRDMVANISHDLRTPLALLQGYLETLSMKQDSFTDEEKRRYVALAARQGERLARLIADLFELTMLESSGTHLNSEPFSLPELVQDVAQKFRPEAERRHLSMETEMPAAAPFVRADIGLIERVLENLIENAIRYTPEGGTVRLSLASDATGIEMCVADTGRGIAESERERIFERFYRVEKSRGDGAEGTGLGLAITRRILQLHDCPIRVESALGRGTAFTFRLPLAQS